VGWTWTSSGVNEQEVNAALRIVFAPADVGGCMYFRCWLPTKFLRQRGHDVRFVHQHADPAIAHADVLVLQRQCAQAPLEVLRAARARGTFVFHEFDDNFHTMPSSNPNAKYYSNGRPMTNMMERFCIEADALLVSTPDLANEYRRFNSRIFVCHNAVDDRQFSRVAPSEITGEPKRAGTIRIGWAGSDTHVVDFQMIVPAMCEVLKAFPQTRLVFVGANMARLLPFHLRHRVEFAGGTGSARSVYFGEPDDERALASVRYYDLIRSADFDLALAPIESTTFNRCKSYLKVTEYGMLGIPAIASRFGPYVQYQREARQQVVLLPTTPREWIAALSELIGSAERRAQLARANLSYVCDSHLMSQRVQAWEDAFTSVAAQAGSRVQNSVQM
jgi:glycosyltransferase involved in cell wall biosynthesis